MFAKKTSLWNGAVLCIAVKETIKEGKRIYETRFLLQE